MNKNDDDFFNFEEVDGEYSFDNFDFEDEKKDGISDELTAICQTFILEHNMPEDTDPESLRKRVWRAIGFVERVKLMFKGVQP